MWARYQTFWQLSYWNEPLGIVPRNYTLLKASLLFILALPAGNYKGAKSDQQESNFNMTNYQKKKKEKPCDDL